MLLIQKIFIMYETKTCIGKNTNEMFFDKSEIIEYLEKISNIVRKIVEKDCGYDFIEDQIDLHGYEFYYNKFYEYWKSEKENGTIP